MNKEDTLGVQVTVKNTGTRAGKEVVQLYITDPIRSVTPPVKQLKGFLSVHLQPGESKIATFHISSRELSFINRDNIRVVEPGEFIARVGKLTASFILVE